MEQQNQPNETEAHEYHSPETVSTIDRLWREATRSMAQTSGHNILTGVVVLSGVLSALFFWRFSRELFVGVHPIIALMLGLVVGLLPAEGAFLGWKSVRATKTDMTAKQLIATQIGLVFAVACSVFGTFSLFVATVPFVPAEISAYANWLVFIAIALPVIGQMIIIAWYEINERSVVENFLQAKLNAMGFDAFIRFETARKQAVIEASNQQLERLIDEYASLRGADEVERLLRGQSAGNIGEQPALPAAGNYGDIPRPKHHKYGLLVGRYIVAESDDINHLKNNPEYGLSDRAVIVGRDGQPVGYAVEAGQNGTRNSNGWHANFE
jgi:hypothetical protein